MHTDACKAFLPHTRYCHIEAQSAESANTQGKLLRRCYLLKKSVMGRATSTASLAFFLGPGFCAAGVPSAPAASLPAAALLPFAASLQIPSRGQPQDACM